MLAQLTGLWRRYMAAARKLDAVFTGRQFRRELAVHRDNSERRFVSITVLHRGKIKGLVVRWRDHHYTFDLTAFQQRVSVTRDRAGVNITRVRRNHGEQWLGDRWHLCRGDK